MPTGVYVRTKEYREKLSKASKGKKKSPEHCKNIGLGHKGMKHSEETKERLRISTTSKGWVGENHPSWKGGRTIDSNGYVWIYQPDHPHTISGKQYVFEHRLVMEKHLGRYLKPEEEVHHINGIKSDNRIENLELYETKSKHRKRDWDDKKYRKNGELYLKIARDIRWNK